MDNKMTICDFCKTEQSDTKKNIHGKIMCKECFMECDNFELHLKDLLDNADEMIQDQTSELSLTSKD